jgi:hypothetical protein
MDGGHAGSGGGNGSDASAGKGGGGGTGGAPVTSVYDCDWGPPRNTRLAPSPMPPGGLAVENVPQFVSIGFDDNAFEDGMQWILDFMKAKTNPAGHGNHCTFDGTPARLSFFINSHVGITPAGLKAQHGRAFREGHEVGNHTDTHDKALQLSRDKALWTKEIVTCSDYLVGLGVPRAAIVGFRAPFLGQSEETIQVVAEQKFLYDCSVEHYLGVGGFDWPYTLDGGKDTTHAYPVPPNKTYAGLWELPVNELMLATTGWQAVTGLDYNMWFAKNMGKAQFVEVLKANLELRMKGGNYPANRAPLMIGGHTDIYSRTNPDPQVQAGVSIADRRAAIEEFLTWALAYHPDVRVVPHAEVLHWMQSPVGLDGTRPQ